MSSANPPTSSAPTLGASAAASAPSVANAQAVVAPAAPNVLPATQAVGSAAAAANAAASTDPAFQLKLEPSDFIAFKTDKFPAEDGAAVEIKLTNTSKFLQCYKAIYFLTKNIT